MVVCYSHASILHANPLSADRLPVVYWFLVLWILLPADPRRSITLTPAVLCVLLCPWHSSGTSAKVCCILMFFSSSLCADDTCLIRVNLDFPRRSIVCFVLLCFISLKLPESCWSLLRSAETCWLLPKLIKFWVLSCSNEASCSVSSYILYDKRTQIRPLNQNNNRKNENSITIITQRKMKSKANIFFSFRWESLVVLEAKVSWII